MKHAPIKIQLYTNIFHAGNNKISLYFIQLFIYGSRIYRSMFKTQAINCYRVLFHAGNTQWQYDTDDAGFYIYNFIYIYNNEMKWLEKLTFACIVRFLCRLVISVL